VGVVLVGHGAHAGELGRARPPVRLDIAPCFAGDRDAILRAVRVELGDDALEAENPNAVAVHIDCAPDGLDAGVVVEVRPPSSTRRYRYALDWRAQPTDARPRLIGLAIAEAVDASRIELTAVPEPPPAPVGIAAPGPPRAPAWTVALVVDQRAFSAHAGVDMVGAGLESVRVLSRHLRLATDIVAEATSALSSSGAVHVVSVSSAPRLIAHVGGRMHGELGLGARIGVASMRGDARPDSRLTGQRLVRPWLGPAASFAVGVDLARTVALRAQLEVGLIAAGTTARDLGVPVATFGGSWTSLGVSAALAL
jgi:hypothetical protein